MEIKNFKILLVYIFSLVDKTWCDTRSEIALEKPLIFHQDNYDECMQLQEQALYCSFHYHMQPIDDLNVTLHWKNIKESISDPFKFRHDILRHGICVPKTCPNLKNYDKSQIELVISKCYDEKYQHLGLKGSIKELECTSNKSEYPTDSFDLVISAIFFCYINLVLFATFNENLGQNEIFKAFSLKNSWKHLTTLNDEEQVKNWGLIQVIRVLSTIAVITTHSMAFTVMLPIANVKWAENANDYLPLVVTTGVAPYYTSLAQMISIFLLTKTLMQDNKDSKTFTIKEILKFVLKRFLRLAPSLLIIVTFHATWLRHSGDGPFWDHYVNKEFLRCRNFGWMNVLFLNNFAPIGHQCVHTTWSMSNDFQYFIVVLLIFYFFKKHPNTFWFGLTTLVSLQILTTFYINFSNKFPTHQLMYPESSYDLKMSLNSYQFRYQHSSWIGNFAGPLTGLGFAKFYYNVKKGSFFKNQTQKVIWWSFIIIFISFIFLPGFLTFIRVELTVFWSSIYVALVRVIFCIGAVMFIFAFTQGIFPSRRNHKYSLEKLSWNKTVFILGRLTFSVTLVHYSMIQTKVCKSRFPMYLNGHLMVFNAISDIILSYVAGTIFGLIFETPLHVLCNILIEKSKKKKK